MIAPYPLLPRLRHASLPAPRPPAGVTLAMPGLADAAAIHALVADCPPLDVNSCYAYLLLCSDFRSTCVAARDAEGICGFVSAYLPPTRPDVLFVWQVAVHGRQRGKHLGAAMLDALLSRPAARGVRYLETTVAPDNAASRAMFRRVADARGAPHRVLPHFDTTLFGDAAHAPEPLLRIGPLSTTRSTRNPRHHLKGNP